MNNIVMSKNSLIFLTSFVSMTVCMSSQGQIENTGYDIKGSVKGISTGKVKLLSYNEDDRTSKTLDSGRISKGIFRLKGKVPTAQMVTVVMEPGNWAFQVFLDNKPVSITADTTGSIHYDYTKYGLTKGANIRNFAESGSQNFDDWMKYQNEPGRKTYDPVFADLSNKIQTAKDIDEQYRYRDQMDSVRKLLYNWQMNEVKFYIDKNPGSVAGAYMLRDLCNWYSDMPFDETQAMVQALSGEAKASKYYASLQSILAKRKAVMPGSIAPDFTLFKRDSSQFTLSSTRGRYTMIDFWASWCHPCRKAIPHWKEVYSKYHDKGFDIVSVSDDNVWKNWFKAMDQEQMPWTQVCDEFPLKNMPARVGSLYMTAYIPFYVLLDKDGHIILYTSDENQIDEKLKEIFNG